MKQIILFAFHLVAVVKTVHSLENSACIGNVQDAPLTNFKNTPLQGWSAFALTPIYSLSGPNYTKALEKVEAVAKKELGKVGKLISIQVPDVKGLGRAANLLNLELQSVPTLGQDPKVLRLSLTLQTQVTINRTGKECSAYIWTSSVFFPGELSSFNEQNVEDGAAALFRQFAACYTASNPNNEGKPEIYLYQ